MNTRTQRATPFVCLLIKGMHTTQSSLIPGSDNQASLLATVLVPVMSMSCHSVAHLLALYMLLLLGMPNWVLPD